MNFQFDSEWEGSKDARSLAEMQVVRRFFIYGNVPIESPYICFTTYGVEMRDLTEAPAELDKFLNEIKQEMKDTSFDHKSWKTADIDYLDVERAANVFTENRMIFKQGGYEACKSFISPLKY